MQKIVNTEILLSSIDDLNLGKEIVSEVVALYDKHIGIKSCSSEKYINVNLGHYSNELLKEIGQKFKESNICHILDLMSYVFEVKPDIQKTTFIKMESIVDSVTHLKSNILWWNDFIDRFCVCHLAKDVGDKLLQEEIPFTYDNNSLTILTDKLNSKIINFNHIVISGGDIDFKLDFKAYADNHSILEDLINNTCNFSDSTEDGFLNPAYYEELSEDMFSVEATLSFDYDADGGRVFDKLKEILAFDKK